MQILRTKSMGFVDSSVSYKKTETNIVASVLYTRVFLRTSDNLKQYCLCFAHLPLLRQEMSVFFVKIRLQVSTCFFTKFSIFFNCLIICGISQVYHFFLQLDDS